MCVDFCFCFSPLTSGLCAFRSKCPTYKWSHKVCNIQAANRYMRFVVVAFCKFFKCTNAATSSEAVKQNLFFFFAVVPSSRHCSLNRVAHFAVAAFVPCDEVFSVIQTPLEKVWSPPTHNLRLKYSGSWVERKEAGELEWGREKERECLGDRRQFRVRCQLVALTLLYCAYI